MANFSLYIDTFVYTYHSR